MATGSKARALDDDRVPVASKRSVNARRGERAMSMVEAAKGLVRGDPLPEDLVKDPALTHVLEIGRIVDARENRE